MLRLVVASAFAAMVAGCGGSGGQFPPQSFQAAQSSRPDASGDLLYIGHGIKIGSKFQGLVTVLTFPAGKAFATIDLQGSATGVCSDSSGNVWVVVAKGKRDYHAYEFAHGGTTPITTIPIHDVNEFAADCAVDPKTGNLAVLVGAPAGSQTGFAVVWTGARPGKPARFTIPFAPTSCAYDDSGNLFVDGWIGSTVLFNLAKLSKGSPSFERVKLDKTPSNYPYGLRWDGKYVDVGDNDFNGYGKIYQILVSDYDGHVVGIVHPKGMYYVPVFDVRGSSLVGTSGNRGHEVSLWHYPAGGARVKGLMGFPYPPRGMAISVGGNS